MISFVNAKINIGLQVVNRREDGYHDLQTIFYPVGLYAGTPVNPISFCDILEIVARDITDSDKDRRFRINFSGRNLNCPLEKNLVYKAARLYFETYVSDSFGSDIYFEKILPDAAGMGGGSADAAFTLRMLRDMHSEYLKTVSFNTDSASRQVTDGDLEGLALKLGADCPFFLYNKPAFASGIGERLEPMDLDLSGLWLLVVKPVVSISTKEAFAGIKPRKPDFDLHLVNRSDIGNWREYVVNDFEMPFFKKYPAIATVKEMMYDRGALYASLTGSGSCIYGIFEDMGTAAAAEEVLKVHPTIVASYLLKL